VSNLLLRLRDLVRRLFGLEPAAPLCDSCKLDYGNVCRRPERPNARTCPDYQRR
jgi:hypothetical protein